MGDSSDDDMQFLDRIDSGLIGGMEKRLSLRSSASWKGGARAVLRSEDKYIPIKKASLSLYKKGSSK